MRLEHPEALQDRLLRDTLTVSSFLLITGGQWRNLAPVSCGKRYSGETLKR